MLTTTSYRPAERPNRRRLGVSLPASVLVASAALAVVLTAVAPSPALAQEALTAAQKSALLFNAYRKFGGKVSHGTITDRKGALTIWNLKYEVPLPADRLTKRGGAGILSMTVETMLVRRFDYRNPDLPHFADLAMKGLRFGGDLLNDSEMRTFQAVFGLDEIVLDIGQNYTLDPVTGSLTYRNLSVALRDVGAFSLTARLDGVDFSKLSDPDFWEKLIVPERSRGEKKLPSIIGEMLLDAVSKVRIHALSYSLTDLGGVGKAMDYTATERSKKNPSGPKFTADMMRDMVAGALAGANARFSGTFAADALHEAARFAIAPGTLTAAARPNRPLPITRVIGFVAGFAATVKQMKGQNINLDPLQKFLGLSVSYTPAAR